MNRKIWTILFLLFVCPPAYAREKNLYHLVEGKSLRVYLGDFKSDTEKISGEVFKDILKDTLIARKKESFKVLTERESAEVIVECNVLTFKYLEKDPIDQVMGTTALIADALIDQNYAQVHVEFSVYRRSDNRRLWKNKFVTSVTQSNMPEPDSIPKVLVECARRFIFLCFGKPKK